MSCGSRYCFHGNRLILAAEDAKIISQMEGVHKPACGFVSLEEFHLAVANVALPAEPDAFLRRAGARPRASVAFAGTIVRDQIPRLIVIIAVIYS
jgi:hypothetical protein